MPKTGGSRPWHEWRNPIVPPDLTEAERDALNEYLPWGAIIRNSDRDVLQTKQRDGTWVTLTTFADHWDFYDAIVDSTFDSQDPDAFTSIQAAIDADAVAIAVNSAVESAAITIASGDSVQRIIGKDADTVTVPVDITCDKDDVTFEQLNFAAQTLVIDALSNTLSSLLISAGGVISIAASATSTGCRIENSRFEESTTTPLLLTSSATHTDIVDNRFDSMNGSVNDIAIARLGGGTDLGGISIIGNHFFGLTEPTGFSVSMPTTFRLSGARITGNNWDNRNNGCLDITVAESVIASNIFSSNDAVKLTAFAGTNIDTVVANNIFKGGGTTHFQLAGANSDHDGLVLSHNTFTTAANVLGSQDALWVGNHMAGVTINFQSKTGIVVIGGDMTGATLQNVNADIVFRSVKGQDDRGDYLPVDGAVDLGSDAKRFAELWLSSNADIEGNLQLDGTLASGAQTVTGHVIPAADDTYDLGSGSAQWKALFIDGTAAIDNLSLAVGANEGVGSDLTPDVDSLRDLGSTARRYALAFVDDITVTTNIVVGGTVDGVDIAARDHAASHTAVSHSDQGATGAELETLTDGSDADALHAHTNTVAEHSDTSATGAELNTLTDTSDASGLHGHGNYTDTAFLQAVFHVNAAQSNTGDIPFVTMDDTQKMHFVWAVPDNWVSTTSIEVVMHPDATETITVDFSIASLAVGEADGANQTVSANETKAVTAAQITEWNITSLAPTQAAGDYLFVRMDSDTDEVNAIGLKIVFVRSQAQ